jgi:hypothetical protein
LACGLVVFGRRICAPTGSGTGHVICTAGPRRRRPRHRSVRSCPAQVGSSAHLPETSETRLNNEPTTDVSGILHNLIRQRRSRTDHTRRELARRTAVDRETVKPSHRHLRNLTTPSTSTPIHREHAVVETAGGRAAKTMLLRNLQDLAGQGRLGNRRRPCRLDPCAPGHHRTDTPPAKQTPHPKSGKSTISKRTSSSLND